MTESQAKLKACPWGVAQRCITGQCMAWVTFVGRGMPVGAILLEEDGSERPSVAGEGFCARLKEAIGDAR